MVTERTVMAIAAGLAVAFVAAQGCDQSGEADCAIAGGQCELPNLRCTMVGPQDCNPNRNPGGAYCCLAETDGAVGPSGVDGATPDAAVRDAGADAVAHVSTDAAPE